MRMWCVCGIEQPLSIFENVQSVLQKLRCSFAVCPNDLVVSYISHICSVCIVYVPGTTDKSIICVLPNILHLRSIVSNSAFRTCKRQGRCVCVCLFSVSFIYDVIVLLKFYKIVRKILYIPLQSSTHHIQLTQQHILRKTWNSLFNK